MPVPVLIPLALAGAAGYLLFAGNEKKDLKLTPAGPITTAQPINTGDAKIDELTKVAASGDASTLAKAAQDMANAGYKQTAMVLATMATEAKAGKLEPIPIPPADSDVRTRTLAGMAAALAEHLRVAAPGKEDRKAVTAYQVADGTLKADGMYGPKTAMTFPARGVNPPPPPRYWPKANPTKAKADYALWLKGLQPSLSNIPVKVV